MVHPRVLLLAVGLALLVAAAEGWSRYWGAEPTNWRRRALVRTSGALLVLALVGFDGAFGLIPDPGVDPGVALAVELSLHGLALGGFLAFFWLRRRG